MLKRETILALFISVVALLIAIGRPVQNNSAPLNRTVTVSVTGSHVGQADALYFSATVGDEAILANEVFDFIEETEFDAEILSEEAFAQNLSQVHLQYSGNPDGVANVIVPLITRYAVIRDVTILEEALVHFADLESTSNVRLYFFSQDTDALILAAQDNAVAEARSQAEQLARLSGMRLGQIVDMRVSNQYVGTNPDFSDLIELGEFSQNTAFDMPLLSADVSATITFELR